MQAAMPATSQLLKTAVKYGVLLLGALLIAGLPGLATVLLLAAIRRFSLAPDSHAKHGISHQQASRLGGLGIVLCAVGVYFAARGIPQVANATNPNNLFSPLAFALMVGLVGLVEDLHGALSPQLRLGLMAAILATALLVHPGLVPSGAGIPGLDFLLQYHWLAFALALVAALGAINAMNIADGANGLMPVVFACTLLAYVAISGRIEYYALFLALLVFVLYNLVSGKLFLGDAGSYGLGAAVVIGALELLGQGLVSPFFLLCLLAYPAIEIFYSSARRMRAGQHPMQPDNFHLHNLLYAKIKQSGCGSILANGGTGLCISLPTAGASVALLFVLSPTSQWWLALFLAYVATYLIIYPRLKPHD